MIPTGDTFGPPKDPDDGSLVGGIAFDGSFAHALWPEVADVPFNPGVVAEVAVGAIADDLSQRSAMVLCG